MQSIFDGMRAGVIAALVVTLWAFIAVSGSVGDAGSMTGVALVAVAFGLLGLPQILYGTALGAVVSIWRVVLERMGLVPLGEALSEESTDRRIAAGLVTLPICAAAVALGVMGLHLTVTSGFARDTFQAQGLALGAGVLCVAAVLGAPLVYGIVEGALRRIPLGGDRSIWTWLVIGLYGLATVVGVVGAYIVATDLRVWSDVEVQMGVASLVLVPLLTGAMHQWRWERGAWNFGIPLAGLAIALGCFAGAPSWATSTAEMRSVTFRDAPLLSSVAPHFVDIGSDTESIYAFDECDDDAEDCAEPEEEVTPLSSPEHPARRAMARAVRAGDRAQINKFESIPDPPKNVVFLMIDTLRQDHMGYAGYERDTTPNIDALAEDAVVFNDAYATSPHTPRTIPPIFFSRYASNIRWVLPNTNFPRVRPENLSVYEVLQERGWKNIAKTSHFYFRERRGLNQGFDIWDNEGHKELEDSHDDVATPRIWAKVEPTLEALGEEHRTKGEDAQPFTMFIHFFDPHASYTRHDEFPFDQGSTNRERLIANYDSEIAHADSYAGRIIDKLKEEELYDDVIFVLTSDHGEAFNEHGSYFHGHDLYNTVLNVPMLIRVPGWFSRRVDGQVSVIDIAPTLLDLVDVAVPDEFEGEALTDTLLGRSEVPDRPVFGELLPYTALDRHHRAIIYNDQKLIADFSLDLEEFYDLSEDPMEQNNLIDERAEDAARLRKMLDEFMQ